jgi:hypothetical protein
MNTDTVTTDHNKVDHGGTDIENIQETKGSEGYCQGLELAPVFGEEDVQRYVVGREQSVAKCR